MTGLEIVMIVINGLLFFAYCGQGMRVEELEKDNKKFKDGSVIALSYLEDIQELSILPNVEATVPRVAQIAHKHITEVTDIRRSR